MIFDWKNNKEEALANGIHEEKIYSVTELKLKTQNGAVAHHTFRNFDDLEFEEGASIEDCIFENCGRVTVGECEVKSCIFTDVEILSRNSNFTDCTFNKIVCHDDCVISMEDGEISGCSFENIKLFEDSYLIEGFGDAWVEKCEFKDIQTERDDHEIFHMEEEAGFIIKRKKEYSFVDEGSCKGLNRIKRIEPEKDDKPALPSILARGVDKGILTAKQAEELHNGQSGCKCDISAYEAELLAEEIGELDLRIPTFNCLSRAGFETVEDIIKLDEFRIQFRRDKRSLDLELEETIVKKVGNVSGLFEKTHHVRTGTHKSCLSV